MHGCTVYMVGTLGTFFFSHHPICLMLKTATEANTIYTTIWSERATLCTSGNILLIPTCFLSAYLLDNVTDFILLQLKTKTLEQNLLEVKLKQQEELNKQAEAKVHHYAEQMTELLKTEQDLRSRLALYGDKFEQFQAIEIWDAINH